MSYVPLEKLMDKSNNSMFKLVIVASRRALELAEGAPKLIEAPAETKITTIAMQEVAEGKVRMAQKHEVAA